MSITFLSHYVVHSLQYKKTATAVKVSIISHTQTQWFAYHLRCVPHSGNLSFTVKKIDLAFLVSYRHWHLGYPCYLQLMLSHTYKDVMSQSSFNTSMHKFKDDNESPLLHRLVSWRYLMLYMHLRRTAMTSMWLPSLWYSTMSQRGNCAHISFTSYSHWNLTSNYGTRISSSICHLSTKHNNNTNSCSEE